QVSDVSLKFHDPATESDYQQSQKHRQKELWMRALLCGALFQSLLHASDLVEFGDRGLSIPLHVVVPIRLALAGVNLIVFLLVQLDLLEATQSSIAALSLAYGVPTVLLFALQHNTLHHWDALFLVYGLSWFVVPKLTPLQFLPAAIGSAVVGAAYFAVAAARRPPGLAGLWEVSLALVYTVPVVALFN
ncbi:unnamed protein product, partial [Phaeothamnion confervicola]